MYVWHSAEYDRGLRPVPCSIANNESPNGDKAFHNLLNGIREILSASNPKTFLEYFNKTEI